MRIHLAICLFLATVALHAGPEEEYREQIVPILKRHCYDCHGSEKQKGDLDLEKFSDLSHVKDSPELWRGAFERVQAYEMPPEGAKELGFDTYAKLIAFFRTLPKPDQVDCDQIASDRNASYYRGYVMSRRLNRDEYSNTIRDLFGVPFELDHLLPADGGGGEGFDTSGNALFTSTIHIEKYMAAADLVLTSLLPDSLSDLPPHIEEARSSILGEHPQPEKDNARETAKAVVGKYARLAFRRSVDDAEVERVMSLFDRAWERGDGYVPSLRLAMKSLLISPNFLFLIEAEPEEKGIQPMAPFPLASKLSYFLWSSMPDAELLDKAESGSLKDGNEYLAQVRRMLAYPNARALGERFAIQWLDLGKLQNEIKPDPEKFPEFDEALRQAMIDEVTTFFNYIVQNDRPLTDLISADYTFANDRLAEIYQIPDVLGPEIRKVALTNQNRGGLVGMAAVSTLNSFPLRTSPILRGRWVLESLVGQRVKPPPADVPPLEENAEATKNLSLREQLQQHRANPDCASCHDKMDPLGFSMENFDVLGRWREMDRGLPIDSTGTLLSGETFTGPEGLKNVLMGRKKEVMKHLVRKMTGYAYGRELNKFDECVVDKTVKALEENDYRPSVLIEQTALSFPFRHRFYPKLDVKNDG